MYILSPIANTVLRNTTGYFSFHYRRYFRTPPLSCPITLSGTLPISSAMSTGRDDQALITSPCIFYPSVQRKPPLYFAQQNTGGRGGVTWPNNRQSVYKNISPARFLSYSFSTFSKKIKKFTFSLGITLDLRLILYSA